MNTIYVASLYISKNQEMENFIDLNSLALKKKVFNYLKDYLNFKYPEKSNKLSYPNSVEYLIEDDEVFLDKKITKILKYLNDRITVQISFMKLNTDISENKIKTIDDEYISIY
jgi:hypothetical protein